MSCTSESDRSFHKGGSEDPSGRGSATERAPPMATVDAARNLLLGILALQNSLIEQADLLAAFQFWSRDKSRSLAQVLVDRAALTEEDRVMLEGLVRRHLEKHGSD